jgi:hypothetical protein
VDRAVGFSLVRANNDAAARADQALERLLAQMPWLTRRDEDVAGWRLVLWGHGDLRRALHRADDESLVAAIGDAPFGQPPTDDRDELSWEGRGLRLRVHADGDVAVANDWTGSIPVYHGERHGARILSTLEPAVVEGLGLGPDDLDEAGVAALLIHGYFLGDRTLFEAMRVLRPDHVGHWTPGGFTAQPLRTLTPSEGRWTAGWDELAEEMAALTRAAIRRTLSDAPRWTLPLSGGIDSRLIAAVAVEEGVDVSALSYGPQGWSDVIYARQLAATLGIPWRRVDLDDRYLADYTRLWADWFGSALHFHGMYQMPFLTAVRDTDAPIVTGFTGDPLGGAQTEGMAAGDRPMARRLTDKWEVWPREQARAVLRRDLSGALEALDDDLARQWEAVAGAPFQRVWLLFQHNHVARFSSYQPLMYDYWKGVGVPFVDRDMAAFALSVPRLALEGRRLQAHMIRRHFPRVAIVPDTAHLAPLTPTRTFVARQAAAALLPRRWRRGPLREFDPAPNTQDQDAARAGGPAAVWPLFETLEQLRDVLDVDIVLAQYRAALNGDLSAMTRVAAVQALAYRLNGPGRPT